jgi:hypothetical protein
MDAATARSCSTSARANVAPALALVFDELARHVRDRTPEVRAQAVRGARMLLGE